jgi:hypothetical protein
MGTAKAGPCLAGFWDSRRRFSSSIAIEANAVAVCFSIPSIRQKTSAPTTATWRPGLITRARQIRRSPDAGDNKFNLYSAVSAGWPRDVAAAIVVALSTRKAVTPP